MSRRRALTDPLAAKRSPLQHGLDHLAAMEIEALKVYRPATDQQERIHHSGAGELLIRGGKRSAKTTCGLCEFGSRVQGVPIIGRDEKPIPLKHPVAKPDDPRLYWIIGWDLRHIGQTLFPKLFEPGLFRVIRDQVTGKWRTFNPANSEDAAREAESQAAGPVIPPRMIVPDSWCWDNSAGGKSGNVFRSVQLINGATICAYPSTAEIAKQGDAVSGELIDEDIRFSDHLKEYQDRLTDKRGWFLWTVWPHVSNYALVGLLDRAAEAEGEENPQIEAVQLLMSENPFFTQEAKAEALERMGDEEEIARRDRGELLQELTSMYEYIPAVHGLGGDPGWTGPVQTSTPKEALEAIYQKDGTFPDEWTRYLAIDPSHTRTAVLFGVVPPPVVNDVVMGNCLVVEDELVLKRATAETLANVVRQKMRARNYEAFVMDRRMGYQTRVGSHLNVFQTYAEAFRKTGCVSRQTRHNFAPSCDRPHERWPVVRRLLAGEDGRPTLFFVIDKTPHTQREFRTYRKKQQHKAGSMEIYDEPANPRSHDCMAALEYLCHFVDKLRSAGLAYVPPQTYGGQGSPAYRYAQQILKQQHGGGPGQSYVHLGAGSAA